MDILDKIIKLKEEKGWSMYKLAEESMLTQSTLSNMFTRRSDPSISTLSKICNAFGITMSEFFMESNTAPESADELLLLNNYRKLSPKNKEAVKNLISNLK